MATESKALSDISGVSKKLGESVSGFRTASNQHTSSLSKIIKDVSSSFSSNKKLSSDVLNALSSQSSDIAETSRRVDSSNKLLRESINIQSQMLGSLSSMAKDIEFMRINMKKGDEKEKDDGGGVLSKIGKSIWGGVGAVGGAVARNPLTAIAGAALGGSAAVGAGKYFEGLGGPKGPDAIGVPGAGGQQGNQITFGSLTEEQKSKFLDNQARAENVDPRLNNPSGMMYSDQTAKFGAQPGRNNGTITLAQFPSLEAGKAAQRDLWDRNYAHLPLDEAIQKWTKGTQHQKSPLDQTAQNYKSTLTKGLGLDAAPSGGQSAPGAPGAIPTSSQGGQTSGQGGVPSTNNNNQNEVAIRQSSQGGGGGQGGQVIQDQMREAGIRKMPISSELLSVLQRAASTAGVTVRVKSGGQPGAGEEGARIGSRTGSTRHDYGMAADLDLYAGETKITPQTNPELFSKFVKAASDAGATGIGAGEGYMGADGSRLHVGFGTPAIWGAEGKGQNAAGWLREALGGGQQYAGGGGGGRVMGAPAMGMGGMGGMQMGMGGMPIGMPMGMGGMPMMGGMGMNPAAAIGGMLGGGTGALIGGAVGGFIPALMGSLSGGREQRTPEVDNAASLDALRRNQNNSQMTESAMQEAVERSRRKRESSENQNNNVNVAQQQGGRNEFGGNDNPTFRSDHLLPSDDWFGKLSRNYSASTSDIRYG